MSVKSDAVQLMLRKQLTLSEFIHEASKYKIVVISPGDIVTADFRTDESRYFVEVNDQDIVVSGNFG